MAETQRHRHDQDDRQRQAPAFVLRRQHQEGQEHAEREDEEGGVAGEDLLVGQFRPLIGHAVGQFLRQQLFHRRLRLAG